LPINAGLPFFVNYKEGEKPKCYSTAWAQSAGWYWEASIQTRKGCGYTFCEDFISFDQAQAEIEQTLGHEITPIKQFRFDTGRLENTWVKNCLAIGLASSFAEPLEATSIHSTIQQLTHFSFEFLKTTKDDTLNPFSRNIYNTRVNKMFDDYKEFLISHYLGGRTDSEFWKYITAGNTLTDFNKNLMESCKSRIPTIYDFPSYPGAAGWLIWCHILVGTGQLTPDVAKKHVTPAIEADAINHLNTLTRAVAKMKLTHYQYDEYINVLKNNNIGFVGKRGRDWHISRL
jgi:tryptophan halogenase